MESIGERIKHLRELKNITQTELAQIIGAKTYTTVSKWESNDNFPKGKDIKILADYFDVTSDYLLGLNNNKRNEITYIYNQLEKPRQQKVYNFAERQLEKQNETKVVRIYGKTAAGEPLTYGDDVIEEREVKHVPKHAECALVVQGDSMEPEIQDGSIVFYKQQENIENGEIAIVEIDGDGVTCKKVKFDYDNDKIILQSINDKYEDVVLEGNRVRIIGKVVK